MASVALADCLVVVVVQRAVDNLIAGLALVRIRRPKNNSAGLEPLSVAVAARVTERLLLNPGGERFLGGIARHTSDND